MITSIDGEKCSPKDLANEIIGDNLGRLVDEWVENNMDKIDAMTEREVGLLNDQIAKQSIRCYKILNMEEVDLDGELIWRRKA